MLKRSSKSIRGLLCLLVVTALPLFSLVVEIDGVRYGPSIEYLTRKPRTGSSNDGIFQSKTKGKTLYLQDFPSKSVVIPLANGKATTDPKTAYSLFHDFHFAHFVVEAPPGHKIMAVIQSLRLATNAVSISGCLDHIEFTDAKSGKRTTNICGEVTKLDDDFGPAGLIGPRYFSSDSDEITVEILIVSSAIRSHGTDGSMMKRFNMIGLTVEIAFTAFRYDAGCNTPYSNSEVNLSDTTTRTSPSTNGDGSAKNTRLRACSPEDPLVTDDLPECISSQLFCDGIMQCGASSDLEFGYDEHNCSDIVEQESSLYDLDESNIQYEVRYRKRLEEMSKTNGSELWLIHYAVLGLAGVVTAILIFSCLCYWGIWLFPSGHNKQPPDQDDGTQSEGNQECNCATGMTSSVEHLNLDMDAASIHSELDELPHRFRSKSLAPSKMPAKLKLNPDGSHSFVSFQGNRRLTISVT